MAEKIVLEPDALSINADWIKTLTWDLPFRPGEPGWEEWLEIQGITEEQFMKLPAALALQREQGETDAGA